MNVLDLFSGIGGFSLGLERAGMKTVAFCENDQDCKKVLRKNWGDSIHIFEDIKPEAIYFTERNGKRGGTLIVDVADSSKFPSVAEPFFLTFNADVQFHIVFGPEDLAKAGLEELAKKYG